MDAIKIIPMPCDTAESLQQTIDLKYGQLEILYEDIEFCEMLLEIAKDKSVMDRLEQIMFR